MAPPSASRSIVTACQFASDKRPTGGHRPISVGGSSRGKCAFLYTPHDRAIVFVFTRLFHDEGWNECSIHSHRDCCSSKYGNLSQQKDRCFQHTDIDSWIQIFEHMFKGNQVVILFILLTVSLSKINSSSSIFSTHKKNTQIRFLTLFWQINSSGVGGFRVFSRFCPMYWWFCFT